MTKEELLNTKIWFGEDKVLRDKIFNRLVHLGVEPTGWSDSADHNAGNFSAYVVDNWFVLRAISGSRTDYSESKRKEITPSQLLGETEEWEPKVGQYVIMEQAGGWGYNHDNNGCLAIIDKVLPSEGTYKIHPIAGRVLNPKNKNTHTINFTNIPIRSDSYPGRIIVRLARPEEIPLEEVEYIELIREIAGLGEKGCIYPLYNNSFVVGGLRWHYPDKDRFKPSTREAYEAQQTPIFIDCEDCSGTGKTIVLLPTGHSERSIDCPTCKGQGEIKNVNKCSTINTNQNECKNENKNSKANDSMDSISGGTGGQEIRLRTKSVRVVCESGFAKSGREVSKTRRSSKRPKAETGRRFI